MPGVPAPEEESFRASRVTVLESVPTISNLCRVCGSRAEHLSCATCHMALCAVRTTSELEDTGERGTWDCICSPTYFQQILARLAQSRRPLRPIDGSNPAPPVLGGLVFPCRSCAQPSTFDPCSGCKVVYCKACIAEGSDCSCDPSYMLQVMLGARTPVNPPRSGVPSSSSSSWQNDPSFGFRARHAGGYTDSSPIH